MKWVADKTGRFAWRPYYDPEELDTECERIVSKFLLGKYNAIRFPLSTDDLSVMMEKDTSDLDLYADLSGEGENVEGLTDFFPDKQPAVKIARELSLDEAWASRLRTTMAHEYGHVKFHNFLWDIAFKAEKNTNFWKTLSRQRRRFKDVRAKSVIQDDIKSPPPLLTGKSFFMDAAQLTGPRCKRGRILDAPAADWMEWQAAYTGGAFLMPASSVRQFIAAKLKKWGINSITAGSVGAYELKISVAAAYDVSIDAAEVRLVKLGILYKAGKQSIEPATVIPPKPKG